MTELQLLFTKYIKIALKNDCIDYFRAFNRNNKKIESSIYDIEELQVSISQDCDIGTFSLQKLNYNDISNPKLYNALNELTDKQKEIICLYADNYSIKEISQKMNVKVATIKSILYKIKKKLNS